ncbi:DNA repair ATPase [Cryomorphaceae bacterium 1068]|nr:DNA repair ATPase [Cryomorphaceae bacterium 1068]
MVENNQETEQKGKIAKGSYDIIRNRLQNQRDDLRSRLEALNTQRKEVFGSISTVLKATERVTTDNNCLARDIVSLGQNKFLFGYNVFMGLRSETKISEVFSSFIYHEKDNSFKATEAEFLQNEQFLEDFKNLYKYYRDTRFIKFAERGPHLFMVFQVGKTTEDIKTFKWLVGNGQATYVDNRSDHEFTFPNQQEFSWIKATRDMQRHGVHPHVSIEDKVFVETVGGNLTIKIEDNTKSGKGILEEPVDEKDQTLDDAEIYYAPLGNLMALKIRPYKEDHFRHFIYNEKIKQALRVDAMASACVLLPDDQGLIFAEGYYVQTGEFKLFQNDLKNMLFEKKIQAPNGEDFLYIFYEKEQGIYVLLSYNIIVQEVKTPTICNGFSLFESGEMILFKAEADQTKHHAIQIWQTPFHSPNLVIDSENKAYLYKIGNKEVVRAMAEANELLKLLNKEDSYGNLYTDITRMATDLLDSYHWLDHKEAGSINEVLKGVRDAADSAISEFEKVTELRKNAAEELSEIEAKASSAINKSQGSHRSINQYVEHLSKLREMRGKVIGLRDQRYIDEQKVNELEEKLTAVSNSLSTSCLQFLLRKEALTPYQTKVEKLNQTVAEITKAADAVELNKEIERIAQELEMLIEIVGNLKIDDSTKTTQIIDSISTIYSRFNQIKAVLSKKRKELALNEGESEFNSQLKLINQSLVNYLDISDSPEACEQNMNKLMVQVEDLEGKFIDFEAFISKLSERREEIYSAFESKKIALVDQRNRRSLSLQESGNRITTGIRKRLLSMSTESEINAYFASDIMVEKVRSLISDLLEMGDSVKADTLQSSLKSAFEDSLRQLRDKTELFVDGKDTIKLGRHLFNTNNQTVDLSLVKRQEDFFFHITATNFFEKIDQANFASLKAVWNQEIISENHSVYRAEYLAFKLFKQAENQVNESPTLSEFNELTEKEVTEFVKQEMATRYEEGYVKGVHDHDAAKLLMRMAALNQSLGLLKFSGLCRMKGLIGWRVILSGDSREFWISQIANATRVRKVFPSTSSFGPLIGALKVALNEALKSTYWDEADSKEAALFIFDKETLNLPFQSSEEAYRLFQEFRTYLKNSKALMKFNDSLTNSKGAIEKQFILATRWIESFAEQNKLEADKSLIGEAAYLGLLSENSIAKEHRHSLSVELDELRGDHPSLNGNEKYVLHYNKFQHRLHDFDLHSTAQFKKFTHLRKRLLEEKREEIRLSEFKPRVLSSFVRNKLLDEVYLPMIGENLAKQIGAAGDSKRTDLMGLLLLISPPGYGKTTLMEYIADRLGLIFMKINGPSLGHDVKSLDPEVATNSGAREELEKLNLAFEMGDNVMIYIDDIQHCNPEFLQKFISLCDAQRKVEGVYKGKSKTYDFRGKKVAVVMAGNPYTESGERFRIPDMLANRADTYNLGDIIGGQERAFALSYLENSISSNEVVAPLNKKSRSDLHAIIRMAESGETEGVELESKHSSEEIDDYRKVFTLMLRVRDIVLRVNKEYIRSASQADEYRIEPPFRLQGSYRNMNKLVEKLSPIMNEKELEITVLSHYENEAQTLTQGAEFNFLRFKELNKLTSKEEEERLASIRETFMRNQKLKGYGSNKDAQLMEQVELISKGLFSISKAIDTRQNEK